MPKINSQQIELIIYDFDGVMTDNKVLISQNGQEAVFCNRSDGLAIEKIKKTGIAQIIISSEANPVVKARANKLKLPCIQRIGIEKKKDVVLEYCQKKGINLKKVIYLGNDLNDLEIMQSVGCSIAPADAAQEVKQIATLVTKSKGGEGVIREFYTLLYSDVLAPGY